MPAATVLYKKQQADEEKKQRESMMPMGGLRMSRRVSEPDDLHLDVHDPATIRRAACAVLAAHEKMVFGTDDVDLRPHSDYFWYEEDTSTSISNHPGPE